MKRIVVIAAVLTLGASASYADEKPSAEELTKITATAKAWGCAGGEAEKETEGTGVFELNDTKCADGANYDIKMDTSFKVNSITAD